ncbi:hypothetical protein KDN24_11850 [Bacillus sp. Bva_UNVM-123]|uniref:hypothetical protein n=1 Tax=Bacillus sp. Bva_UNVM-123 TaxID=2829798 RepID=UPI00391F7C01
MGNPIRKKDFKAFFWSNHFFEGSDPHKLVRSQQSDELFLNCMMTYSMRLLKKDALTFIRHSKTIDIPHDLLAEFHVAAMVILSTWWHKNPNLADLGQIDQYFQRLVNENIFDFNEEKEI